MSRKIDQSGTELAAERREHILGVRIDCTDYDTAVARIISWAAEPRGRMVCASNAHMVMQAHDDAEFARILSESDLVVADGMSLVAALRLLGLRQAQRVYGPELALRVCRRAAAEGLPIGLYGVTDEELAKVAAHLQSRFPGLQINCRLAPPYRPLTEAEDAAYTKAIIESGCRILLVGIGCPKQEKWMYAHLERIPAVMLGVGASFDFYSGRVRQAPPWMQRFGLEWFFRLCMEPKRLWRRYVIQNPRFVFFFLGQWLRTRFRPRRPSCPPPLFPPGTGCDNDAKFGSSQKSLK